MNKLQLKNLRENMFFPLVLFWKMLSSDSSVQLLLRSYWSVVTWHRTSYVKEFELWRTKNTTRKLASMRSRRYPWFSKIRLRSRPRIFSPRKHRERRAKCPLLQMPQGRVWNALLVVLLQMLLLITAAGI